MSNPPWRHDQLPLFWPDDPKPIAQPPREQKPFDPAQLRPSEYRGGIYVLDVDLARAIGYTEPRDIRKMLRRLEAHPGWGSSCHRGTNSGGRGRPGTEWLLDEKQVVLVCMQSRLPDIGDVQSLIADVFLAWGHGRLRPADAETEVELQEATDKAIDKSPDFMSMFVYMKEAQRENRDNYRRLEIKIDDIVRRRDAPACNVEIYERVVRDYYGYRCPCCGRVLIYDAAEGEWSYQEDHATDNVRRNHLSEMWIVCKECNKTFRRPGYRDRHMDAFRVFQLRVREIAGTMGL